MKTLLQLPFPPSVNGLFSTDWKTKRRFTSQKYTEWLDDAYHTLLGQRDRGHRHKGKIEVVYTFTPPDKRARDCFNYEKACSDFLVTHQIIKDDSFIMKGTVQWLNGPPGVTIVIWDLE